MSSNDRDSLKVEMEAVSSKNSWWRVFVKTAVYKEHFSGEVAVLAAEPVKFSRSYVKSYDVLLDVL